MTVPSIQSKSLILRNSDGLVDLYVLDLTAIGGTIYHLANTTYDDGTLLSWGGQEYQLCPIGIDNIEFKAGGSDLPQANVTIYVGQTSALLAPVTALGDIVGGTISHYRTYVSYLDGGANPSTSEYWGPVVWRIAQKSQHQSGVSITWLLTSQLDLPGAMFPVRQVLVYPNINPPDGIYFPGVSPYRTNQYQSQ
jgi:lambda family phage minor tail protein L